MLKHFVAIIATVLALGLGACTAGCQVKPMADQPVPGYVTDMDQFDNYLATRPTPTQFRAHYPDVLLVLPGEIATKERRFNNSRFFAELDGDGRISGGRFG